MLNFDINFLPENNWIQRLALLAHKSVEEMFKNYSPYKVELSKRGDSDWVFTPVGQFVVNLKNFFYSITCKTKTIMNYHVIKDDINIGYRTTLKELQELINEEMKSDEEYKEYFEKKYGRKMTFSRNYKIRVVYCSYKSETHTL